MSTETTPEERAIRERTGGLAPMHLVDAETKETLHDNRDAKIMAQRSLGSWDINISNREQSIRLKCPECNYKTARSFTQLFGTGWHCGGCDYRHTPLEYPEEASKFSEIRVSGSALSDTDRETFISKWYFRKTRNQRYVNIVKRIPNHIIDRIMTAHESLSKTYSKIRFTYDVIKAHWSK